MTPILTTPPTDARTYVQESLALLRDTYGIDVAALVADPALSHAEKRARALPQVRAAVARHFDISEAALEAEMDGAAGPGAAPNLYIDAADVTTISNARGDDIKTVVSYYQNLVKTLAGNTDPSVMAATILAAGVLGIGAPMGAVALKALVGKTSVQAALKTFLSKTGARAAIVAAVVLLLIDITVFLVNLTRDVFGLVVNLIPQPLNVAGWNQGNAGASGFDLYVPHGTVTTFMYALKEEVNLLPALVADAETPALAALGFVAGSKNTGFYGIEAMMILRGANVPYGLAVSFCNPYGAASGVNAAVVTGPIADMGSFYDQLYAGRSLYVSAGQGGDDGATYVVTAAMGADSGEEAYFTAVVSAPQS